MAGTGISFHRQTVTVIRASTTANRYGDDIRDWNTADEVDLTGVRLIPQAADNNIENVVDRDRIIRRWVLFAPPDADVVASDRIRYGGDLYEIDGEVRHWPSPSGRLSHIEADLTRVEG